MIAKFPHPHDEWDVMRWEATAFEIARRVGITTAANRLIELDGRGVVLSERFDRTDGLRIGYLSAMSLLQARDGDARDYVEIAEALSEVGEFVKTDLIELWTRMVFSVAFRNTDDHLRNHGFLRTGAGWRLAPMFDVNPNPSPEAARTTGISGAWDCEDEADGLLEAASSFGVDLEQGRRIIGRVIAAASEWSTAADRQGISGEQVREFAESLDGALARLTSVTPRQL